MPQRTLTKVPSGQTRTPCQWQSVLRPGSPARQCAQQPRTPGGDVIPLARAHVVEPTFHARKLVIARECHVGLEQVSRMANKRRQQDRTSTL